MCGIWPTSVVKMNSWWRQRENLCWGGTGSSWSSAVSEALGGRTCHSPQCIKVTWGILVTNYFLLHKLINFQLTVLPTAVFSQVFHCDKVPERNSVKREESLEVQPVVGWLHCCGPMVGMCGRTKFTYHNRQEVEMRQEESGDKRQPPSVMSQETQSSSRVGLISFQYLPKQSHPLEIRPSARAFWDISYSNLDDHQQLCFDLIFYVAEPFSSNQII